jgi:hypothetical protein
MSLIFNLMDFDRVQQYSLIIDKGPYTSESWILQDNNGRNVPQMVSYLMQSDSVSEVHKIVFTRNDQSTLELAVVGVSTCSKISDGKSSPP